MRRDNEDEKEEDGGNSTRGLLGDILPPPSPIGPCSADGDESDEVSGLGAHIGEAIAEALSAANANTESPADSVCQEDTESDTVLKARAAVPKKGAKGKAKGKAAKSKAKNKANATTGKRKA